MRRDLTELLDDLRVDDVEESVRVTHPVALFQEIETSIMRLQMAWSEAAKSKTKIRPLKMKLKKAADDIRRLAAQVEMVPTGR